MRKRCRGRRPHAGTGGQAASGTPGLEGRAPSRPALDRRGHDRAWPSNALLESRPPRVRRPLQLLAVRPGVPRTRPATLLVQQRRRGVPDVRRFRARQRPGPGQDHPRPAPEHRQRGDRLLADPRLQGTAPRVPPGLPRRRHPDRCAVRRPAGIGPPVHLGRRRGLGRHPRVLRLARNQAVQGPRPRHDRPVSRLLHVPDVRRAAAEARGPERLRRRQDPGRPGPRARQGPAAGGSTGCTSRPRTRRRPPSSSARSATAWPTSTTWAWIT